MNDVFKIHKSIKSTKTFDRFAVLISRMPFISLLSPRQQQHNTHYKYMENTQSLGLQDSEQ